MRIGLVCPYSLDVAGGVQNHVKDLAETLIGWGHSVSVLAPSDGADLPAYVVATGGAVPVPFNGSVARMAFGPVVATKVHRWLRDGAFDVLHIHEPTIPSISLLALWMSEGPVVATYHSAHVRSRALLVSAPMLRPSLEKIDAHVAVSEYARDTRVHHVGGEPVVIPNGLHVARFAAAVPRPQWQGADGTVAFVGRLDEPRKGFGLAVEAFAAVAADRPGLRLLVVGRGDLEAARTRLPSAVRDQVRFLGPAPDVDKAAALSSADVYVAPNTGGESFGIVLAEAMAAGTAVLASDLPAFRAVLGDGRFGALFASADAAALGTAMTGLLDDRERRDRLCAAARTEVRRYDWSTVGRQVMQVYETVRTKLPEAGTP